MKTNEMPINPNVLLEMTETRLHCLKGALEAFIGRFGELLSLICEDLQTTEKLRRKLQKQEGRDEERKEREEPDILCIKIGPREHGRGHCRCHGRKGRGGA